MDFASFNTIGTLSLKIADIRHYQAEIFLFPTAFNI